MEAAHQNKQLMKGKVESAISKVTQEQNSTNSFDKQKQCKKEALSPMADCTFKDINCHKCGKKGHIAKVCRTERTSPTQWIETEENNDVIFLSG